MASSPKLTRTQWLICVIASIGFAFDIYELLMLPLIVGPALLDLGGIKPGSPEFNDWVGRLFYIPALAGGIFGLLGGYLTDYSAAAACWSGASCSTRSRRPAPASSTSIEMLLVLRCLTFIGVCVEFVAAVAWLAELFPEREQRETVLGYTQAFSSFGGLLVTVAYYLRGRRTARLAGDSRRARSVALHADLRVDSGDPADHHPSVPAGIARLAAEEGRRHAEAPALAELFAPESAAARRSSRRSCSPAATAPRSAPSSTCRASCPACRK